MSDNIKRILVIDDEITMYADRDLLFQNAGVDVEVAVVRSLHEGIIQLEAWAADGFAADLIDTDYFVPFLAARAWDDTEFQERIKHLNRDKEGVAATEFILEWAAQQPEHVRPKKLAMHSATPGAIFKHIQSGGELDEILLIHGSDELIDISYAGEDITWLRTSSNVRLREWMNNEWGTIYPTREHHVKLMRDADAKLKLYEVEDEIESGRFNIHTALRHLDVDNVLYYLTPRIDRNALDDEGYDTYDGFSFGRSNDRIAKGRVAFNTEQIAQLKRDYPNEPVILALQEFMPSDTHQLSSVDGIILLGEGTEHLELVTDNHGIAAVFESSWGNLSVTGSGATTALTYKNEYETEKPPIIFGDFVTLASGGTSFDSRGREVTSGALHHRALPIIQPSYYDERWYESLKEWMEAASAHRDEMAVKANADNATQVAEAIAQGANGIGLLRTEHMFFEQARLQALQNAILTNDAQERQAAFETLRAFQRQDFQAVFEAAEAATGDFPITIRLLDAPPAEFLEEGQQDTLAQRVGEDNMRGVQLAVHTPGLYAAQVAAMFEAAQATHYTGTVRIMVPLIRTAEELQYIRNEIESVAEQLDFQGNYQIGSMIETLGAVAQAEPIARLSDFISFGTNDLTSEVMGDVKRNDIAATRHWMAENNHQGLSPFLRLAAPVEELMRDTIARARAVKPEIDIGICGRQVANEAESIRICHNLGLNSISVPATAEYILPSRIMALQAALGTREKIEQENKRIDNTEEGLDGAIGGETSTLRGTTGDIPLP